MLTLIGGQNVCGFAKKYNMMPAATRPGAHTVTWHRSKWAMLQTVHVSVFAHVACAAAAATAALDAGMHQMSSVLTS